MTKPPSTQVMEIFSQAAAVDAADREALLDEACRGDPELRAEVESLLSADRQRGGFLAAPEVAAERAAGADDLLERDVRAIGQGRALAGRYAIVECIGEGGFGVVYRVRQSHPIRREAALKIVKLGMDTRQVVARFELERQTLALMEHPNIARLFDAGVTADGRPYFAMELVDGSPITAYCEEHKLTIPRRLELFMVVCQAVQHAHQKGIIHRDLKPSNILVVDVDGEPTPKIIDFGIAKAMQAAPADGSAVTELRHVLGTPQYMSPEQAGLESGGVDTRSDVYSLGVLLYELLTGATPFDPDRLRRSSPEQTARILREEEPPRPSAKFEVDSRPSRTTAVELDWIVGKAMEKDPALRYQSAGALGDDVRRHLAHEPLVAGPPNTLYRVQKFARRHSRFLAAAAVVGLALLLGLAGATFGLIHAKRDRDRAESALAQAEKVGAFLSDMLRSANPDRSRGERLTVRDMLDRAAVDLDQGPLRDQPLVEARLRMTLSEAYESLGLYPQCEAQARRALDIRREKLGVENRDTAASMVAVAMALHVRPDAEAAEALAREALAIQEKLLGPQHADSIRTLHRLGTILRGKKDQRGYEAATRRAVELSRESPSQPHLTAIGLTNLGVALMDRGAFGDAEPLIQEALSIDRALHGEKFRNVPRNLSNLATIRQARGDFKGAEAMWLDALARQRAILPSDHPDIAWTLRLLGGVKQKMGDYDAAEKHLRHGTEMERRIFGPKHPIVAVFLEEWGQALQLAGRDAEAAAARKEALDIRLSEARASLAARPNDPARRRRVTEIESQLAQLEHAATSFAPADLIPSPRSP